MKNHFLNFKFLLSSSLVCLFAIILFTNVIMIFKADSHSSAKLSLSTMLAKAHDGDEYGDEPATAYARKFVNVSGSQVKSDPVTHCTYQRFGSGGVSCEGIGHKSCTEKAVDYSHSVWILTTLESGCPDTPDGE